MIWTTNSDQPSLRGSWDSVNCGGGSSLVGAVCKKQQICNSVPSTTMPVPPPSVPPTVSNSVKSTTTVGIGIP